MRSRPSRSARATFALAALFCVAGFGGCKDGSDVMSLLDGPSRTRLAGISGNESLLFSVTAGHPITDLPPLGDNGKILGRSGNSVLLEMPRAALLRLEEVGGIKRATVWGDGEAARRIEPALRSRVLEALDADDRTPIEFLATFREAVPDLRERIAAGGANPRTVAGKVATVTAAPDAIFELMALPDLVRLSRPRVLRTLGNP